MSDETPEVVCLGCRAPLPVGGVVGWRQPVTCARCGTQNSINSDGERVYRVRPAGLEIAVRRHSEEGT